MSTPTTDFTVNKQHAIPQNIMSVEFKLIGSMTVRQFMYAAIGVIGGYLCYVSGLPFIFKWPLVLIVGLGGLGFAFIPLGDRGMDLWIRNFLMAISKPTVRIWKKEPLVPFYLQANFAAIMKSEILTIAPANSRAKLLAYLGEAEKNSSQVKNKLDVAEELFLERLNFGQAPTKTAVTTTTTIAPAKEILLPSNTTLNLPNFNLKPTEEPEDKTKKTNLTEQVLDLKSLVTKIKSDSGVIFKMATSQATKAKEETPHEEVPALLTAELKKLEMEVKAKEAKELAEKEVAKQTVTTSPPAPANAPTPPPQPVITPTTETSMAADQLLKSYQVITKAQTPKAVEIKPPLAMGEKPREVTEELKTEKDIVLSNSPNVINGVVKDSKDKMIQGAVVVVKDEGGDPVRALKTNEIGQFVISTPLPNGKYYVTVSLLGRRFATMEVIADGRLLPPLSFVSKDNIIWKLYSNKRPPPKKY